MSTTLKTCLVALSIIVTSFTLKAQQVRLIDAFDIKRDKIRITSTGDTVAEYKCVIVLHDTTVVRKLHVKAGNGKGSSNRFNKTINYNPKEKKAADYSRKEYTVEIPIGEYPLQDFYSEVQAEDKDGKQSKLIKTEKKKFGH